MRYRLKEIRIYLFFLDKDKSSDSLGFSDDFKNAVTASPSLKLLMVPWCKLIYIDALPVNQPN